MRCPTCSKEIDATSQFCQHCGTQLGKKDGWQLFKEFWQQFGLIGAIMVFVGSQLSVSSITALIEGISSPSMQGQTGTTVWGVFVKTLPFTLAVTWLIARLLKEQLKSALEIALRLMAGIGLSYLLSSYLSPDIAEVPLARARGASPFAYILAYVESFFRAYGPVAFIQSIILGSFFGYWVVRVLEEKI
jgi:predicted nucleic acid-binding Zn ribbon protein